MEILLFLYLIIIFIKYSLETKILLNESNSIDLYFKKNSIIPLNDTIFLDNLLYILMNFPVEQVQYLIEINYDNIIIDEEKYNRSMIYDIINECWRILKDKEAINKFFSFLHNDSFCQSLNDIINLYKNNSSWMNIFVVVHKIFKNEEVRNFFYDFLHDHPNISYFVYLLPMNFSKPVLIGILNWFAKREVADLLLDLISHLDSVTVCIQSLCDFAYKNPDNAINYFIKFLNHIEFVKSLEKFFQNSPNVVTALFSIAKTENITVSLTFFQYKLNFIYLKNILISNIEQNLTALINYATEFVSNNTQEAKINATHRPLFQQFGKNLILYFSILFKYYSVEEFVTIQIQKILLLLTQDLTILNISEDCKGLINYVLFGKGSEINETIEANETNFNLAYDYFSKFLLETAFQKNNFITYDNCIQKIETSYTNESHKFSLYNNYIISIIEKDYNYSNISADIEQSFYFYGFCFFQASNKYDKNKTYCKIEDYRTIMEILLEILKITKVNNISKLTVMEINNMNKNGLDDQFKMKYDKFKYYIPLVILLIPLAMFFILFFLSCKYGNLDNNIPKEIRSNNSNRKNNIVKNQDKVKKPFFYLLLDGIFNLCKNGKDLFNFKIESSNLYNVQGLTYIKGLIGISLILTLLGQIFFILVNFPAREFGFYQFYRSYYGPLYIFVFFGLRYSPRILFSCSGYTFSYKYISFIEKEKSFYLLKFLFLQSYKYVIYILIYSFLRFTEYPFCVNFLGKSPLLEIYNKVVLEAEGNTAYHLLSLGIINFLDKEGRGYQSLFDYFWMVENEIFFFVFGIILLSVLYKLKIRADYVIIILVILLYVGKIVYCKLNNEFFPTLYFYLFYYGRVFINPLYNLSYFLIGMYFGLLNYTVQKGIIDISSYMKQRQKYL